MQLDSGRLLDPDLLVGADGAHSMVADAAGLDADFQDYGQDAVVALMFSEKGETSRCWQCFNGRSIVAWLPLGRGWGVVVCSCPRADAGHLVHDEQERFDSTISHLLEYRCGSLQLKSTPVSFPLYGRLVKSYTAAYCVLVGDAAHTIHPLAGQGANSGLADVDCLGRALDHYRTLGRSVSSLAALQYYQRLVKGRNMAMKLALEYLLRGFSIPGEPWRFLRSRGLHFVDRCVPIKNWFAHQAVRE